MSKFNNTHVNEQVYQNIVKGCYNALKSDSGVYYINNRKGEPYLRVKKVIGYDDKFRFKITDRSQSIINEELVRGIIDKSLSTSYLSFVNKNLAWNFEIKKEA